MSANKSLNGTRLDKQPTIRGLVIDFAKKWEKTQKELVDKHNDMAAQLAAQEQLIENLGKFTAKEFGTTQANLNLWFSSVEGALHHHDVSHLASAEILREIFGQLVQIEHLLQRVVSGSTSLELSSNDLEQIKTRASEWFNSVINSAFSIANSAVDKQKREAEEARKVEMEKIAIEKNKAAEDKTEAERVEAEFQRSELQDRGLTSSTDSTEQETLGIPADVRIFGIT